MSDRYMPGVPCWADTSHPDPVLAARFYAGLFGWAIDEVMPGAYFMASLPGGLVAGIGGVPEGASPVAVWNTYVWVDSADETAAKVRDAGGAVVGEPFDVGESGRMAVFTDPEGAAFSVWQPKEHRGAAVVNEHGSVNFNNLHTRDLDAAKAFYGAVFGWEALEMGGGAGMWRLPGYGDLLERLNPGTRARVAEVGGPPGFEDVVAAFNPITDDTPPRWTITFGVDDADAIAENATKLGGTVLSPPVDAPWVRTTVIADPQGATFTANKFVLENKDLTA